MENTNKKLKAWKWVLISSAVATITAGVGVAIGYAIWHNKSQPTKIFCKDVKTTTNLTGYFLMLPKHLFSFVNIDSADQLIYKKDHSSLIYFVGANDINEFGMNRLGVNARDNFTLSIKTNGNIDLQGNVLYDESLSCYVVGIGNDWKMNKEDWVINRKQLKNEEFYNFFWQECYFQADYE